MPSASGSSLDMFTAISFGLSVSISAFNAAEAPSLPYGTTRA